MTIKFNYDGECLKFETLDSGVIHDLGKYKSELYEYAPRYNQICEVQIRGRMTQAHTGLRHARCSENGKFQYESHSITASEKGSILEIVQKSDLARLHSFFYILSGTKTFRTWHRIENISQEPFTLEYISTYNRAMLTPPNTFRETEFWLPSNGSYCECQWSRAPLSTFGVFGGHNAKSFKKFCISNTGSWPTKTYLPMGIIKQTDGSFIMWQIEANGSWSYELSDLYDSLTLQINGPTFEEHNWQKTLHPGENFETVKAAITTGASFNEIIGNMTRYRRAIVDKNRLVSSVIFNEYMYASWNTPSEETAQKLIPVAKDFGADYYIIDCGWHDEEPDPFYFLGKWQESVSRYPSGLKKTIDRIKNSGMIAGLWLEPEVVGTNGDAYCLYGKDAYFSRSGKVLGISRRYQLDFRCKEVIDRLNSIIGKMVEEYGIGYLKIDYNIEAGVGTDNNAESCGNGLLEHNRAYLQWLKKIREKYPSLVIENCASGGNRMDYLTLENCDVQSTSDQTDYKVYPYIAANMFSALLPEQAAVWAYPASHASDEQPNSEYVIMNMVNGLAGQMHLASKLYLLNESNAKLVQEAVLLSKKIVEFRKDASPWFHKDMPTDMEAGQVVYGMKRGRNLLVFVYRMQGKEDIHIEIGKKIHAAQIIYPGCSDIPLNIDGTSINVSFPNEFMARIIEIKTI